MRGVARWRNEWVRNGSERMRAEAGFRRGGRTSGKSGCGGGERASVRLRVRSRLKDRIKKVKREKNGGAKENYNPQGGTIKYIYISVRFLSFSNYPRGSKFVQFFLTAE